MEPTQHDRDINGDCSIVEDAFSQSNMDLYYGYDTNELVEVEHEPCKYWLARIVYNYKQLLLLRWECDYGEFWLDTSANSKRRCYPPGHYLQPQLKSQYELKRPPKPPTRKDPYANIKNVDDLLSAEEPLDHSDAIKCKNIPFKPEDAKELEAALQALNELNCDSLMMDCDDRTAEDGEQVATTTVGDNGPGAQQQNSAGVTDCSGIINNNPSESITSSKDTKVSEEDEIEKETRMDEERLHTCKTIRHKAIEEYKSKIALKSIIPKPRQFYDLGGVSPERLFVPGAILEICHYKYSSAFKQSNDVNLSNESHTLSHWFAIVIENIGGRLTLRWLLSDDPKFKQGRLEMKNIGCSYVEEETANGATSVSDEPDQVKKIPVKEVSFRLHYCHPSISTVGHGQSLGRSYSLPEQIENSMLATLEQPHFSYLLQQVDTQDVPTAVGELVKAKSKKLVEQIKKRLYDSVFDPRRINLDKDRPLIDYILHIIKKRFPNYIDAASTKIYFNHKCFSGPALSKGKICSLPQYVGPGPVRLVMEEVVTKVISVAYVPPRILNDLSSKNFEDLLISRNIINTSPLTFKAKYQKRVYREELPVIINAEDVEAYCECICEHLKCCYNLFGPNLYDGDDCPGHCRGLTKSNKFMKRAIYYREKARLGEFVSDASKKNAKNSDAAKTRQDYGGRASQESTGSRCKTPKELEVCKTTTDEPSDQIDKEIPKEMTIVDKKPSQDILKAAQVISDESEGAEPNTEDPNLTLSPLSSSDQENHINTQISDQCNINEGKQDEKFALQTEINLETNGNLTKRKRSPTIPDDFSTPRGLDPATAQHQSRKKLDRIKRQSTDVDYADELDKSSFASNDYCPRNNNQRTEIEMDGINQKMYSEVFQWSIDDVYKFVKDSKYSQFATHLREQVNYQSVICLVYHLF